MLWELKILKDSLLGSLDNMKQPTIEIVRYIRPEPTGPDLDFIPTLGLLYLSNGFFCFTLEPSWKGNNENSCIPDGRYKLVKYVSKRFGTCLIIPNVKRRTGILFHKGNTQHDTTGCILLGSQIGFLKGRYAVLSSSATFMRFMSMLSSYNGLKLKIKTISKKYGGLNI